jgi:peptidoglycan L-alanyl-D-glutamate endopeptidase CwlK
MNARSETALATVNPTLADKVRAAAAALEPSGIYLLVVSGLRTADEQNALYAIGRTVELDRKPVTNAKAGQSMHNYGLAVDVAPYVTGESGQINWNEGTPQFQSMVTAIKAQGLAWGGDWVHFKDYDHFQISSVPSSPTSAMEEDYGTGDQAALTALWMNVDDGKYAV